MNEVYDDVGDEYDNDEDEDCVDIDAVEARPDLGVMRDDVDYDDVDCMMKTTIMSMKINIVMMSIDCDTNYNG